MHLIIVESPTKSKTISRFLSKGYLVKSSYGHIRDLPKSELGVDTEKDFEPKYVIPTKSRKAVKELKEAAKKADLIILATDEDREGEAIAWHIVKALNLEKTKKESKRIVFHEITKKAIEKALENPRQINFNLVDAQQARRILDRLVGYKLSPFLWKKVAKGLSAGRVQSVAVRLIVDREKEIKEFKPEEYWTVDALLKKISSQEKITARLIKKDDKLISKLEIKDKETAEKILKDLAESEYKVVDLQSKQTKRHPFPPFTTSTLQQEAARRLGFSAKQTMQLAQQLYEGIDLGEKGPTGLITYHRTDSFNLAEEALVSAHQFIKEKYGTGYTEGPRRYKTKSKGAQEAHEAIRPTLAKREPERIKNHLNSQQYKLYNLIWQRFIASQMKPALLNTTTIDIQAKNYLFRASGSIINFDGFLKVYPTKLKENILPKIEKNELLELIKLIPEQHFTQPPARYNEASLVKLLEEYGIGRPSTYAPIISTIQLRGYVRKNEQKRFEPTEIGTLVTNLLKDNFSNIVDIKFTARMEKDLDEIADGKQDKATLLKNFYEPFSKNLMEKYEQVEKHNLDEKTDKKCPECGKPLVIKTSRFGKFYACSGFPECRYKESIANSTHVQCPECHKGEIVERRTKKGKIFYSCSRYPDCKYALWNKPTGEKCPKCGSLLVENKGKVKCSNKECGYIKK